MNYQKDLKKAVEVLQKGGLILYPTDTFWGIGCDATNADAIRKVYELKGGKIEAVCKSWSIVMLV